MSRNRIAGALLLCAFACAGKEIHPITKRRIAQVTDPASADSSMRREREAEERPYVALDAIMIPRGGVVADVGAGLGYFTGRLAERVGPQGTVYGQDIRQSLLDGMMKNMRERGVKNVRPVLGTAEDPGLPPDALDLVLLVDVYNEFSEPEKMIDRLRDSLKPGGRLVLLEYRAEDEAIPVAPEHKMTVKQVRAEIEPQGLRFDQAIEVLPRQHIIIFRRP